MHELNEKQGLKTLTGKTSGTKKCEKNLQGLKTKFCETIGTKNIFNPIIYTPSSRVYISIKQKFKKFIGDVLNYNIINMNTKNHSKIRKYTRI